MGNDGGSIPKRRELVKEAAAKPTASEAKETQQEALEYAWTTCPLSLQPLKPPVVSDCAGKLYNKDAILEYLLPGDEGGGGRGESRAGLSKSDCERFLNGRVKGLKDVVEVKFEVEKRSGAINGKKPIWVCPVTNKTLGPAVKAVYLVPCGHAFSEMAIKEMGSDTCLQCNEAYTKENVISILPASPAERDRLARRLDSLKEQGLSHALKKVPGSGKKKKSKHSKGEAMQTIGTETETSIPQLITITTLTTTTSSKAPTSAPSEPSTKHLDPKPNSTAQKRSIATSTTSTTKTPTAQGINNAATASLTTKVLAEEEARAKRRKMEPNANLSSLFTSSVSVKDNVSNTKNGDFMTRGFSIPTGAKYQ
ncbi:hypothetical protein MMC25_000264 [Agyrium rufum]|nr:hypothetical protein [Agyrium rufum]